MMLLRRIFLSLGAGFVTAVLVGIALAVVDLYLSGHGWPSARSPWINWDAGGVHMSLADVILLLAIGISMVVVYRLAKPDSGR